MPPTFAGSYIQEPSDLRVVCTEAVIIAICDDAGGTEARGVQTFADLTPDERAAIVGVMDSLIIPAEQLIESYARRRGYTIPLSPVDATVKDLAARLIWIQMRVRAGRLTGEAANAEREVLRAGELRDIADGRMLLTATRNTATPAPAAGVYRVTTAATRDTAGRTTRHTRQSLEGL